MKMKFNLQHIAISFLLIFIMAALVSCNAEYSNESATPEQSEIIKSGLTKQMTGSMLIVKNR